MEMAESMRSEIDISLWNYLIMPQFTQLFSERHIVFFNFTFLARIMCELVHAEKEVIWWGKLDLNAKYYLLFM